MLRQVFYVDITEVAQTGMQGDISEINTFDFQTLHQLTAKVQAGCRSSYRTFVLGEDGLETFRIFRLYRTVDDGMGQGSLTQSIEGFLELIVRSVIKETERTAAGSGVVYYFRYHRVVGTEIQLVADTDFTGRIYQHIPQTEFFVQLTQQEYFDTSSRLLLITIQTCREYLRIVEYKYVFIIKVVQNILEHLVFNLSSTTVQHHQARLISILRRMQSDFILG